MGRVPDAELERLKREVSVARLAEARGIALTRHGADLHGLCPFHEDRSPSLVISPERNLWHCLGACQAGGSVIDWVMKSEPDATRCSLRRTDRATRQQKTARPPRWAGVSVNAQARRSGQASRFERGPGPLAASLGRRSPRRAPPPWTPHPPGPPTPLDPPPPW
ncbi:MAG TPA: CHC2 zinc finger domain-containing protein, partial [Polyangia bacterium]|nr:CHC2 zinc finger domain-containing protein [Polyangia bacterium]